MKIAEHYNKINDYYIELNKTLKTERDEIERRAMEEGLEEAHHENPNEDAEWRVINDAWAEVPAAEELEEEEPEEDEEGEENDGIADFFDLDDDEDDDD